MESKEKTPPVNVGDVLKHQECISEGKKNDGVCKYDGYIIFVNNCTKGEIVSFKVTKVLKNFGIGEKIKDEEEDE